MSELSEGGRLLSGIRLLGRFHIVEAAEIHVEDTVGVRFKNVGIACAPVVAENSNVSKCEL